MKIKRYFAADMRQAIRLVRDEQGPDAVILSNRRVDGGVEIVAAVDYDEALVHKMAEPASPEPSPRPDEPAAANITALLDARRQQGVMLHPPAATESRSGHEPSQGETTTPHTATRIEWAQDPVLQAMREEITTLRGMLEAQFASMAWGDSKRRNPMQALMLQRLTQLGLSPQLSRKLVASARLGSDLQRNWRSILEQLARHISVTGDDILERGGVVALVGATGVGKTTSIAKLAARFTLRHGKGSVALITTDSYRIGAQQQLRAYGSILGAPVYTAHNADELRSLLEQLSDKRLVLIDTAGMSQRDVRLSEQFAMLRRGGPQIRSYVVLSATSQRSALDDVVRSLGSVSLSGCIISKVDECVVLGSAISVAIQHKLPLAYLSDGQRVPEDLHPARTSEVLSRAISFMKQYQEKPADEAMAVNFGRMAGMRHE